MILRDFIGRGNEVGKIELIPSPFRSLDWTLCMDL
jgi:hypothetical protein